MDLQKLDDALLAVFEKRVELSQLTYDSENYDDVEEELHDLEDDFNEEFGDYIEKALHEVHQEYCPESDVLLPTAYIAKKFIELPDGSIEIGKKEGVEVELESDPANGGRLVLLPTPTRIVLMYGKTKSVVWQAAN
ncbi:hypothetical protein SAMN04515674_104157 [Pseudarcicella hirudinis]|uniref:Uncharacterized protein n=1 Tax=Pseudarcicella hirudinis TaxID=1079859 RepID=A0A1I5RPL7_9BACT|nr:hypothetical protein [Pseudarcicella hirudinis]SFP59866.1 hypothetical protein SAMN04515674_104157 [Pseudarcicella hirudinis]